MALATGVVGSIIPCENQRLAPCRSLACDKLIEVQYCSRNAGPNGFFILFLSFQFREQLAQHGQFGIARGAAETQRERLPQTLLAISANLHQPLAERLRAFDKGWVV